MTRLVNFVRCAGRLTYRQAARHEALGDARISCRPAFHHDICDAAVSCIPRLKHQFTKSFGSNIPAVQIDLIASGGLYIPVVQQDFPYASASCGTCIPALQHCFAEAPASRIPGGVHPHITDTYASCIAAGQRSFVQGHSLRYFCLCGKPRCPREDDQAQKQKALLRRVIQDWSRGYSLVEHDVRSSNSQRRELVNSIRITSCGATSRSAKTAQEHNSSKPSSSSHSVGSSSNRAGSSSNQATRSGQASSSSCGVSRSNGVSSGDNGSEKDRGEVRMQAANGSRCAAECVFAGAAETLGSCWVLPLASRTNIQRIDYWNFSLKADASLPCRRDDVEMSSSVPTASLCAAPAVIPRSSRAPAAAGDMLLPARDFLYNGGVMSFVDFSRVAVAAAICPLVRSYASLSHAAAAAAEAARSRRLCSSVTRAAQKGAAAGGILAAAATVSAGPQRQTTAAAGKVSGTSRMAVGGGGGVAAGERGAVADAAAHVPKAHLKTFAQPCREDSSESSWFTRPRFARSMSSIPAAAAGSNIVRTGESSRTAYTAATGEASERNARALQLLPYAARDVAEGSQRRIHFAALLTTALSTPRQQQRVAAFLFEELRHRCALQLACLQLLAELLQQAQRNASGAAGNTCSSHNSSSNAGSSRTGGWGGGMPVLRPLEEGCLGEAQEALLQQFSLLLVAGNALKAARKAGGSDRSHVLHGISDSSRGRAPARDSDASRKLGDPRQDDCFSSRSSSSQQSSSSTSPGWVGERHFLSLVHALRCMHSRVVPHVLAGSRARFRTALQQQEQQLKQQYQQPRHADYLQQRQQKAETVGQQSEGTTAEAKRRVWGLAGRDTFEQTEEKIELVLEDFVLRGVSIGLLLSHFELLYHQTLRHAQTAAQHARHATAAEQQQHMARCLSPAGKPNSQQQQQRTCCTYIGHHTRCCRSSRGEGCGQSRCFHGGVVYANTAEKDAHHQRDSSCETRNRHSGRGNGGSIPVGQDSDVKERHSNVGSEDSRSHSGERGNCVSRTGRRKDNRSSGGSLSCTERKTVGRRTCCCNESARGCCSVNSSRGGGGRDITSFHRPARKAFPEQCIGPVMLQGEAELQWRQQHQRHWFSSVTQQQLQQALGRVGSSVPRQQQYVQQWNGRVISRWRRPQPHESQQQRQGRLLLGECWHSGGAEERLAVRRYLRQCDMQHQQQACMHSSVVMQQQQDNEYMDSLASYPAVGMIQRECSPSAEFRAAAEKVHALCCRDLGAAPALRLFVMCRPPAKAGAATGNSSSRNGVGSSSGSNARTGDNTSIKSRRTSSRSSVSGRRSDSGSSGWRGRGQQNMQDIAPHGAATPDAVACSSLPVSSPSDAVMFPAAVLHYVFVELLKNAMRATLRRQWQEDRRHQDDEEEEVAGERKIQQLQQQEAVQQHQAHSQQAICVEQRQRQEAVGKRQQPQRARHHTAETVRTSLERPWGSDRSNGNSSDSRSMFISNGAGNVPSEMSSREGVGDLESSSSSSEFDSRSGTVESNDRTVTAGVECRICRVPGGVWIRLSDRGVGMDATAKVAAFRCLRKRDDLLADAAARFFASSSSKNSRSAASSSVESSALTRSSSSLKSSGRSRVSEVLKFPAISYGSRSSDVHRRIFLHQNGAAATQEGSDVQQHSHSNSSSGKENRENEADTTESTKHRRRSTSEAPRMSGYGVGLLLSRAYLRYFGGGLAMRSAPGEGTDVFVFLPSIETKTEVLPDHPGLLQRVFAQPSNSVDRHSTAKEEPSLLQQHHRRSDTVAADPVATAAALGKASELPGEEARAAAGNHQDTARENARVEKKTEEEEEGNEDIVSSAATETDTAALWGAEAAATEELNIGGASESALPAALAAPSGTWANSSDPWELVWRKPEWGTVTKPH